MAYSIQFKPVALRRLGKLPREVQKRIASRIEGLREDPFPSGCKKLEAIEAWRVRVGDYRVVYQVHRGILLVLVVYDRESAGRV